MQIWELQPRLYILEFLRVRLRDLYFKTLLSDPCHVKFNKHSLQQ